ncbi:hypothetical protein ORI20_30860, partial [Mycobacterium sp. CVI_P3]|nr:hypothetical protein [Mycobacterium pinniadriaticum]MCX2941096.1 hypothetical protein [Mycobacterium pinniadriaticum]
MSTPDEFTKGVKTLGIKLKPDVHAQLSFIAQLRDGTITDEIQIAIAEHIARAKDDPDLASKGPAPVCWTRLIPQDWRGKRDDPPRWQGKIIPTSLNG